VSAINFSAHALITQKSSCRALSNWGSLAVETHQLSLMKRLGGTFFFFGVGSTVLYFLNMEFVLLAWIDLWGAQVGWAIRIALAVVGGAMWLMGKEPEAA
jgi:hypothetical protein